MAGVTDEDTVEEGGGEEAVFAVRTSCEWGLGTGVVDCSDECDVAYEVPSDVDVLSGEDSDGLCLSVGKMRLLSLIYRGCGDEAGGKE